MGILTREGLNLLEIASNPLQWQLVSFDIGFWTAAPIGGRSSVEWGEFLYLHPPKAFLQALRLFSQSADLMMSHMVSESSRAAAPVGTKSWRIEVN